MPDDMMPAVLNVSCKTGYKQLLSPARFITFPELMLKTAYQYGNNTAVSFPGLNYTGFFVLIDFTY